MNLSDVVGTVFDGKYQIERMLGRGGMGAVFFAKHLGTDRPVALKVIVPQYAADASFLERFRREARAAGRFRHPNIVDVTDFGQVEVGGQPVAYLVMEYLDGCSLEDVLVEQPILPVDWTVEVLDQLTLGIAELHKHGIIHRDLKPGNIWLEPNLRGGFTVKLLDFGLAKIHDPESAADDLAQSEAGPELPGEVTIVSGAPSEEVLVDTASAELPASEAPTIARHSSGLQVPAGVKPGDAPTLVRGANKDTQLVGSARPTADLPESTQTEPAGELTVAGSVLGTPAYMSPEQCRGEVVSTASDVYSLGVITYQMLGGSLPFQGNIGKLMAQHMHVAAEQLDKRNPEVPDAVAAVVMSALAKDPADRPASASLYAAALRSKAETPWELVRRGLVMYLEHFTLFVRTTAVLLAPYFLVVAIETAFALVLVETMSDGRVLPAIVNSLALLSWTAILVGTIFGRGVSTLLIAQIMLAPLRKVRATLVFSRLRSRMIPALQATFLLGLGVVLPATVGVRMLEHGIRVINAPEQSMIGSHSMAVDAFGPITFGAALVILAYVVACDLLQLANAVVAEALPIRVAIRRSRELRRRAPGDTLAVGLFVLFLPVIPTVLELWLREEVLDPILIVLFVLAIAVFRVATIALNAVLVAVLYVKERHTAGESIDAVLSCQYVSEPPPQTLWQQRLNVSLESLRSSSKESYNSHSDMRSGDRQESKPPNGKE